MATRYVENVHDEMYEALRNSAKQHLKSMASEVISLLEENIPTAAALEKRRGFVKYVKRLQRRNPPAPGPFPSADEMVLEDRER
jgi:hypothetical protein